jgi:hypothetical protein
VNRTSPSFLVIVAVASGAIGWVVQVSLVANGRSMIVPPVSLSVVLTLIGALLIYFAVPVYRTARRTAQKAVDPFYATRVVVLAQASSVGGALFSGATVAILAFILTRPVVPAVGSLSVTVAAVVGAIVLLAAGLVAERMCTLPPDDENPDRSGAEDAA